MDRNENYYTVVKGVNRVKDCSESCRRLFPPPFFFVSFNRVTGFKSPFSRVRNDK